MLTDLGYAKRQILFARAANGRHQTSAVDDALARALDAIERLADAASEAIRAADDAMLKSTTT